MTTVRFVCLLCFSMLSCKYVLPGIKAKGRSWYSTKCVPFSSQATPGSRLQSLTHHGVSAGEPSRFNTGRIALQSGDSPMLVKTHRHHLYSSEEKESWIKKKKTKQLVMHGMQCQLLKQTGSQELAQPAAKKQQHLEVEQAAGRACSPSHRADLCPKRHLFAASNPKCNRATQRRG